MANSPCKMDTVQRIICITVNTLEILYQCHFIFINSKILVLRHLNQNTQPLELDTKILIK